MTTYATSSRLKTAIRLDNDDRDDVLRFLAERPLHTVFMASLIRENGVVSERNRGSFYGIHDDDGKYSGVGLLGHATLIEARTDAALQALASMARTAPIPPVLMRGERREINRFWTFCQSAANHPRMISDEQLLVNQSGPSRITNHVSPATHDQLEDVITINVNLFMEESGRNPLNENPDGFRDRIARRIDCERVWIAREHGEITFKADIVADTPEAIYLESIWVNPRCRRQGHGLNCLTTLNSILLERTKAICLTVDEKLPGLSAFYQKAGFEKHSSYQTIYLR